MSRVPFQHAALLMTVATFSAGCSTMPAFGPDAEAINQASLQGENAAADILPFELVNVTAATLPAQEQSTALFPVTFRNQQFLSADETIGIGDQLDIRIWEVAEDGLFATAGNRETELNVQVKLWPYYRSICRYAEHRRAHHRTTAKFPTRTLPRTSGRA